MTSGAQRTSGSRVDVCMHTAVRGHTFSQNQVLPCGDTGVSSVQQALGLTGRSALRLLCGHTHCPAFRRAGPTSKAQRKAPLTVLSSTSPSVGATHVHSEPRRPEAPQQSTLPVALPLFPPRASRPCCAASRCGWGSLAFSLQKPPPHCPDRLRGTGRQCCQATLSPDPPLAELRPLRPCMGASAPTDAAPPVQGHARPETLVTPAS